MNEKKIRLTAKRSLTHEEEKSLERLHHGPKFMFDERCIHQLFEDTARKFSDLTAVVDSQHSITFQELDQRSNQLARYLIEHGVQPGDRVVVQMKRSVQLILSTLAIWKARAIYVPVDPAYPPARKEYIFNHTLATCALADSEGFHCQWGNIPTMINLEEHWESISGMDQSPLDLAYDAADLCYIMYTSGSTGSPKGVMVEHRSLANMIQWFVRQFQVSPQERASQGASITFDPSLREIWPNLVGGAILFIMDDAIRTDPIAFWRWIRDQKITICYLTAPLAELMLQAAIPDGLSLKYLTVSGEKMKAIPPTFQFKVINLYGPTEATTHCTFCVIDPTETVPHIGRPIDNTSIYILDEYAHPVPPGFIGEIGIGGVGVSRGYWNDLENTASKFIVNPVNGIDRIYLSGDLGRFRPDGNIEYIGRKDFQYKIRGQRIETAEIEAVLDQTPGIAKSLVRVFENPAKENVLVAYILEKHPLGDAEILAFIKRMLPEAFLPSRIIRLESLPYTLNGKYDRLSLPEPAWDTHKNTKETLPSTPTEKILVEIWKDILGIRQVGVEDNFFKLGGHSLLIIKLCIRIQEHFKKEVSYIQVFENPTIRQLARLLEHNHAANNTENPQIMMNENSSAPLSPAQRSMWFLQKLYPQSNAYHINLALELTGDLDEAALQHALNAIVERHSILRTTFPIFNDMPVQLIHPFKPVKLTHEDANQISEEEWENTLRNIIRIYEKAFNLEKEIPTRYILVKRSHQSHMLVIILHHILFDGASVNLFLDELTHYYHLFHTNQQNVPLETPPQFSDFARQQNAWMESPAFEEQLKYWKTIFTQEPPVLELPGDFPRAKNDQPEGKYLEWVLPQNLVNDLRKICSRENVTPFMLLLTAFKTLLHRYTGLDDITVGVPYNLRRTREQQKIIGVGINSLALRSDLSGNPTFRDLLKTIRRTSLSAYMNANLPFDRLVEELGFERTADNQPIFQVMFQVNKFVEPHEDCSGLQFQRERFIFNKAKFDLTLNIVERDDMLCVFNYNAERFKPKRIDRMARHFQTLLEGIATNPETPIDSLPLLSASEYNLILYEWNQTRRSYPSESLPVLFSQQAAKTPDSTALLYQNQPITYHELNEDANRLANYLTRLGVQPGDFIAICTDNSPEMIDGLLAILKTGSAYIPIDPSYPVDRIHVMLRDSKPRLLLTKSRWLEKLQPVESTVVLLDTDWQTIEWESPIYQHAHVASDQPAYIMYTSGSTGIPKGVVIPHKAINRLVLQTDYIQITPGDTIAQVSNFSFDAATFEIWGALLNGACLALIPKELLLTPRVFGVSLNTNSVTVMFLTTSLFNYYVLENPQIFSSLRCLLFGGEEANADRVRHLLASGYKGQLINVYGPTENTTFSTWFEVKGLPEKALTIPIGKPIANTQAYILDAAYLPVPVGIPGELYLGGDGLALEYLNQPELTSERFIDHPFANHPGEKLYRTGDICQYQEDGSILFLGRQDDQIKLRGYRVELGEINAVLCSNPAVQDAVVLLLDDPQNEKRLAAYLTPTQTPLTDKEIRDYLETRLPVQMVPSVFTWLGNIPISPNGKIDRARLPEPNWSKSTASMGGEEPVTPTQQKLADIWKKILKIEQVGIHDNFFSLGGHSILVVSLCVLAEEVFSKPLSFSQVFDFPTIAEMAEIIDSDKESSLTISEYEPTPAVQKNFFFIGSGFSIFSQYLTAAKAIRMPDEGEDGKPLTFTTVEQIAAQHVERIRAAQPEGPYAIGGFSFGGMLAFESARQLTEHYHQEVSLVFLIEPTTPFLPPLGIKEGQLSANETPGISVVKSKIALHARTISKLSVKDRLSYLWAWIDKQYQNRVHIKIISWLSRQYHQRGQAIPIRWRHHYIKDMSECIAHAYQPKKYRGKIVLVESEIHSQRKQFSNNIDLPAAETQIIQIEGCHTHLDMMQPPHFSKWMDWLNQYFSD